MSREMLRVGREHHRPWHRGDAAVQLPVDEVADTPEEQAGCARQGQGVGDLPERNAVDARKRSGRDRHPDQGSVERQAAVPDPNEFGGVVQIVPRLVDDGVHQAGPEDHSGQEVADQRVKVTSGQRYQASLDPRPHDPVADEIAHQIHDAVPAHRERTDANEDRRNVRVRNDHTRTSRTKPPRRQTINVTTYPTNAASTTSLMKWAPLATRVSAHPKARPYHRSQPCGNSRAITAAAAKASAVSLLGSPSCALETARSDQARKTWAPSARPGRSRRNTSFRTSAAIPAEAADPNSNTPRRLACRSTARSRGAPSCSTSASATMPLTGTYPARRSMRPQPRS